MMKVVYKSNHNSGNQNQYYIDILNVMLGGHVRVGLEDNLYIKKKSIRMQQFIICEENKTSIKKYY